MRKVCLQAPSLEKYFVVCDQEFGLENVGKRAIIKRATYGDKATGRDFRKRLKILHVISEL